MAFKRVWVESLNEPKHLKGSKKIFQGFKTNFFVRDSIRGEKSFFLIPSEKNSLKVMADYLKGMIFEILVFAF